MDALPSEDGMLLRARLEQSRERLADLVRELRGIDRELEGLATERRQHALLHDACAALDALGAMGAAGLFWGEGAPEGQGVQWIRRARGRVDAFQKRVSEIEDTRDILLEAIGRAEEDAELVADDVLQLEREEEQRRLEWVIEREVEALPGCTALMPWTRGGADDERFRKALAAALLASLLLGVLIPLVQLPLPQAWEPIEVPERFARLIRQERPLPPPPPAREQPLAEERPVEPNEKIPPARTAKPAEKPSPESKGILAFRERFSGLADTRSAARLGAQARITRSGEAASGATQRSMVATRAAGSSGGINLAALSRDVGSGGGGDGIEGIQVARATSSIGGSGTSDRPRSDGPGLSRTDEEIQIVFDRHKAALYRLYNRELRQDPTLKGQMVLRLRIEPDGSVSLCEVHGTDMKAPRLSAQVVERVRTFDFGAKDGIGPVTILYPIDFLPAA
jgi:hypothetical protein